MPDADRQSSAQQGPSRTAGGGSPGAHRCPECGAAVASIAVHLRQVHRIFEFRGIRRPYADTVAYLLSLLFGAQPDPDAWDMLAAIAQEENGDRAAEVLATLLSDSLARLEQKRRAAVAEGVGAILAAAGSLRVAAVLASDAEIAGRHLALAVLAHLPPPLPDFLVPPLRGLLLDRRLPVELLLAAAAVLIRGAGATSPLTTEVLETLVTGLGKKSGIERLRQLEKLTGPSPAIEALCGQLEDRLRMTCPRCGAEHRKAEMVEHLWQEHRLVLDGRRVRDPWAILAEWVDAFKARHDPELLERCRIAGPRIDPERGLARVYQLFLVNGIEDSEAQRFLLEDARAAHASLCPSCYAPLSVPRDAPPFFINQYRGRLSARGYRVEINDAGYQTLLEVEKPGRLLQRGFEPGHRWTARAMATFVATPFVLLALVVALGIIGESLGPIWPVVLLVIGGGTAYILIRRRWGKKAPVQQRSSAYAWTLLAPHFHEGNFHIDDSAFLVGLARRSIDRGDPRQRAPVLGEMIHRTEAAVWRGLAPPTHLSWLRRLQAEDVARTGGDPVPAVAAQLARCFQGRLPMSFAEQLLAAWDSDWWTRGNLARLRILLCDHAFEAGFEVCSLIDASKTAPSLGRVLDVDRPDVLAGLRLLWSLRPRQPWKSCGNSLTAFEVAADRQRSRVLGRHPDLLLFQEEPDWPHLGIPPTGEPETVRIELCVRGVLLQDVLITSTPLIIDQINRPGATDIAFGEQRFRSRGRMEKIGPRMQAWFRFAFDDFLPQIAKVHTWQPPDRAARLRSWGYQSCPECRTFFLPRPGDVGTVHDEKARAE
jgi:hypothetical protein